MKKALDYLVDLSLRPINIMVVDFVFEYFFLDLMA
jgi:hypothetical protein